MKSLVLLLALSSFSSFAGGLVCGRITKNESSGISKMNVSSRKYTIETTTEEEVVVVPASYDTMPTDDFNLSNERLKEIYEEDKYYVCFNSNREHPVLEWINSETINDVNAAALPDDHILAKVKNSGIFADRKNSPEKAKVKSKDAKDGLGYFNFQRGNNFKSPIDNETIEIEVNNAQDA